MQGFSCKCFFHRLVNLSSLGKLVFLVLGRIKDPRKVRSFTWEVLHCLANTLDSLVRKLPLLVRPFLEGRGRLGPYSLRCDFASGVWDSFFQMFGMMSVCHREASAMIEEFSSILLLGRKAGSFVLLKCVQFYGFCGVSGTVRCLGEWRRILGIIGPLSVFMLPFGRQFQRPFIIKWDFA